MKTKTEQRKIEKKLYKAIDALIAVQDLGGGSEEISRALETLNSEVNKYVC